MTDDNRRRALADVVTADAWHPAFSDDNAQVDLHVDVVFSVGRIGGGDTSGVRFRLSLRRAEVVVIVPELEPVKVAKASVRRDAPKPVTGKIEERGKVSKKAGVDLQTQAAASATEVGLGAKAKAMFSFSKSRDRTSLATQSFSGMSVVQSQSAEGHYRWTVTPDVSGADLNGRPWDARKSAVLELVDQRADRGKGIPPSVRIEVRCLREDLEISNIVLDDDAKQARLRRRKGAQTRWIAAEAAIRTMLAEGGLVGDDFDDPYAQLSLAMITAEAV